jgi:hypothetical protein
LIVNPWRLRPERNTGGPENAPPAGKGTILTLVVFGSVLSGIDGMFAH